MLLFICLNMVSPIDNAFYKELKYALLHMCITNFREEFEVQERMVNNCCLLAEQEDRTRN